MNKLTPAIIIAAIAGLMSISCLPFIPTGPTTTPLPEPTPAPVTANLLPVAYIYSIIPTEAVQGDPVSFQGHGTDDDGSVVAYLWSSSQDGDLGTTANFETTSLSEGDHVIRLIVQDNNGDWSEEATTILKIEPREEPTPEPVSPSLEANWSGQWDCGIWGIMTLSQSGERVTGTYTYQGGILTATATGDNGNTLIGTWSEDPTHIPPEDAGDIEFTMSADGNSFTGHWRYDSSGSWQSWEGERME
ncbi:MAG: PKD domain-containing protein [Dehalococcoidales bacterium]|nr:PKD domain-containing protein [Dehalococcoidales bacterium]